MDEMRKHIDLRGKRALVTGGASGIGLAIAEKLAAKGAEPILLDMNRDSLDRALASLRGEGYRAQGYQGDVTSIADLRKVKDELEAKGLSPDILVNCAGITLIAHVTATDHEEWQRIIGVNLMGTVNTIETFLPAMVERGFGHVVNIGSIDGFIPIPGQSAYCASKFAVTGLTEVLYYDLKHNGVGVTLVCPGYVKTPLANTSTIKDLPLHFKGARLVERFLLSLGGSPRKVAGQVVEAITHGRFLVIPGVPSRIIYHYRRLFPRLATRSGLWVARFFAWWRKKLPRRAMQSA
ncbi:MAG: SDR family NAD(P)-dependent oxidoreductase [Actinobacteria bacterium]|nr:SDR family NAD(P)-dependent oxidoreductase [Actinomycetota bacterium]